MFGLVSFLVFTTPLARNELGLLGGLKVMTDDDATVYVGDRKVGTGTVEVAWNELLGSTGRPPLAIAIDSEPTGDQLSGLLADGARAKLLWQADGPTGTHRGKQDADFAFNEVVLLRPDGLCDHVILIDCQFPNATGAWQRALIPVRVRKLNSSASDFFPRAGVQTGGNVSRGMIPSRRDHATFELKLSVGNGAVPGDLADRLSGAPMWVPVAN